MYDIDRLRADLHAMGARLTRLESVLYTNTEGYGLEQVAGELERRIRYLEDGYNTSPLRARDPQTGLNLVDRIEHLEELVDLLVDAEAEEFEAEDELLAEATAAARAAGNDPGYDLDFIEGYLARAHEED